MMMMMMMTDKTDRETGQRSDSIKRTVLQAVVNKSFSVDGMATSESRQV